LTAVAAGPSAGAGGLKQAEPGRLLKVTHHSPLTGDDDVAENYHTLRYELSQAGEGTAVSLTQDGCESEEQAKRFSQNWQEMLNGLKKVAEAD